MKKQAFIALALAALVAVPVLAGGIKFKQEGPLTWAKANGSGATTFDSNKVSVTFLESDTTNWIDMYQYRWPNMYLAADTTTYLYKFRFDYGGTTADTAVVTIQSTDNANGGTVNTIVARNVAGHDYALGSWTSASLQDRYIRAIYKHNDGSAQGVQTVRGYFAFPEED